MTGSMNDGNLKNSFPSILFILLSFLFLSVIKRKKKNLRELYISPYHSIYFPDTQIRMTGYDEFIRHYDKSVRHLPDKIFLCGGARAPLFC
jgi:hypothetical protein